MFKKMEPSRSRLMQDHLLVPCISIWIADANLYSNKETASNSMASRDYLNYKENGAINGTDAKVACFWTCSSASFGTILMLCCIREIWVDALLLGRKGTGQAFIHLCPDLQAKLPIKQTRKKFTYIVASLHG